MNSNLKNRAAPWYIQLHSKMWTYFDIVIRLWCKTKYSGKFLLLFFITKSWNIYHLGWLFAGVWQPWKIIRTKRTRTEDEVIFNTDLHRCLQICLNAKNFECYTIRLFTTGFLLACALYQSSSHDGQRSPSRLQFYRRPNIYVRKKCT